MESRPRIEIGLCVILAALALAYMLKAMHSAEAREAEIAEGSPVPCALIESLSGEATLLDSTRANLLPVAANAAVPCGAWITTMQGSVALKHRDGFRIHLGSSTFVQVPDADLNGKSSGDQLVLFHGQAYVRAPAIGGEFRVVTPNSRSRIQRASAIVVYSRQEEETQLVALEGASVMENRFQTASRVIVRPGEASSLNFKLLRVLPSAPAAISVAALRPRLDDLRVPERERALALRGARERQERVFAAPLVAESKGRAPEPAHPQASRTIASDKNDPKSYARHEEDADSPKLRRHWVNRIVAGEKAGLKTLYPVTNRKVSKSTQRRIAVEVEVEVEVKGRVSPEDAEKRRLIEELSRIREE